jgi:hypothetical protein
MFVTKRHSLLGAVLGFVLFFAPAWTRAAGIFADMVIYNGKILTANSGGGGGA